MAAEREITDVDAGCGSPSRRPRRKIGQFGKSILPLRWMLLVSSLTWALAFGGLAAAGSRSLSAKHWLRAHLQWQWMYDVARWLCLAGARGLCLPR